jgi:uncharacterized protein (DUF2147 family)
MKNRKGISTFIATLLLMVLAVSAGVVIYAYTMGYLGGFGGTEQLGAMSIDEYSASDGDTTGDDNITAYIRNIGKSTIVVDRVYVDDDLAGDTYDVTVEEGDVGTIVIICQTSAGTNGTDGGNVINLESGKTYEVKIIAEDNTQVSFSVKAD